LKIGGADTILRAVTNPLQNNYLVRGARSVIAAGVIAACGHKPQTPTPEPTAPLPTAGVAAQQVSVRRAVLAKSDSVIGTLLRARAPEVTWVLPDELRRAARRAPGIAPNPDQMGSAMLLHGTKQQPEMVPDPLRSELRTLSALAGAGGGRYALIPAGLVFRRASGAPDHVTATAELTVVMVDVRTGRVGFRTVARGDGDDPWTALTRAVKSLTPGLP
jgi:hypothetical protein